VKLTTSPRTCAECYEIWEPKPPGTLWVTPGLLRDCFTFTLKKRNWAGLIRAKRYSVSGFCKHGSETWATIKGRDVLDCLEACKHLKDYGSLNDFLYPFGLNICVLQYKSVSLRFSLFLSRPEFLWHANAENSLRCGKFQVFCLKSPIVLLTNPCRYSFQASCYRIQLCYQIHVCCWRIQSHSLRTH